MSVKQSPTFLSLFSGCGGLDLGFTRAGFLGALSLDFDDAALAVHRLNLGCPVERVDLSQENQKLQQLKDIDVLLAGSPCQGFSTVGLRRVDDPRNSLLLVAPRVAAKLRPKIVVAENVLGAISGAHRGYWDQLHGRLRALGYHTQDLKVNSHDFGVAQSRQRILLIAWRTGVLPSFHIEGASRRVLGEALNGLEGVANHCPRMLSEISSDYKIAARIGQGQKLTNSRDGETAIHTWDIPEVFGRTTIREREVLSQVLRLRRQDRRRSFGDADPISTRFLRKKFGGDLISRLVEKKYLRRIGNYHDLTNTFNGKYRRLRLDAPSRTVDTKFGQPRLFLHPTEHRGFTVREAARIQGFPDDFIFSGTLGQQFSMIGNAVPPPMAYSVAQLIRSML